MLTTYLYVHVIWIHMQCVSWYFLRRQPSYTASFRNAQRIPRGQRCEVGFVGRLGRGPLAQDDPDGSSVEIWFPVLETTVFFDVFIWGFPLMGCPKWMVYNENPIKMDDWGGTPILGTPHIWCSSIELVLSLIMRRYKHWHVGRPSRLACTAMGQGALAMGNRKNPKNAESPREKKKKIWRTHGNPLKMTIENETQISNNTNTGKIMRTYLKGWTSSEDARFFFLRR